MKQLAAITTDDKGNIKFNLQNYPPAWTTLGRGSYKTTEIQKLRAKVAFFYRASEIVAHHAARIPFKVIDQNGETVTDSSDDFFSSPFKWLDDFNRTMQLVTLSLIDSGKAYLLINKSKLRENTVLNLQYVLADSMTPKYAEDGQLDYFERQWVVEGTGKVNKVDVQLDEVIYFWPADSSVENAPPQAFAGKAAMSGAETLYNMQQFKANYFENGAIKIGFVTYQNHITKTEADTITTYFRRAISGLSNAWKQVVPFRNDIKWEQVGDGLESLDNDSLTQTEREEILAALGVPPDMVLSPSGGMDSDVTSAVVSFYDGNIIPMVDFIYQQLNKQLVPDGYKLVATPEMLPMFQEDEGERATLLRDLVTAGMDLIVAMKTAGYPDDIIEEQAKISEENKQMAMEIQAQTPPEQEPEEEDDEETREEAELNTLRNWCRKRAKADKEAHPSDFKSDVLSYNKIAEVMEDYGIYYPPPPAIDSGDLFGRAIDDLYKMVSTPQQLTPHNITVNVTPEGHTVNVEPSEIKAHINVLPAEVVPPDVVVNVPESNNVINVTPTPIVVENDINFPRRMREVTKVKRNQQGFIDETESTSEFED